MNRTLLILIILLIGLVSIITVFNEISYSQDQNQSKGSISITDQKDTSQTGSTIKGGSGAKGVIKGTMNKEQKENLKQDKESSNVWYMKMLTNLVWQLALAVGFSIAVSLAIVLFNFLTSTKIKEWSEIKRGNIGTALILVALIIMTGVIIIGVA